jgi:hypothetical protein
VIASHCLVLVALVSTISHRIASVLSIVCTGGTVGSA